LTVALLSHAALALVRFSPKANVIPLVGPAGVEIDLETTAAPQPLPKREPGGGTPKAGSADKPEAKPQAQIKKPAFVAPPKKPAKEATKELVHEQEENQRQDAEPDADLDPLLAEAFSEASDFSLPKARAVRTSIASSLDPTPHQPLLSSGASTQNRGGRYIGAGPGEGGGPGGNGRGNGRIVAEKFVFGGPNGHFKGDICAIPRMTASIDAINECPHLLTFFTDRINVPTRRFDEGFPGLADRVEWFAIKYTGKFRVKRDGVYFFRLNSDDGSRLLIDNQLLIDNDGQHAPRWVRNGIRLSRGEHALKLIYFQGPGALLALQLFVTPPGRHEKPFRPEF
jgi:hypothetical protein